jgi:hypothetical protein
LNARLLRDVSYYNEGWLSESIADYKAVAEKQHTTVLNALPSRDVSPKSTEHNVRRLLTYSVEGAQKKNNWCFEAIKHCKAEAARQHTMTFNALVPRYVSPKPFKHGCANALPRDSRAHSDDCCANALDLVANNALPLQVVLMPWIW